MKYINHYECKCGECWTEESNGTEDDRCPKCRQSCSPSLTEDTRPVGNAAKHTPGPWSIEKVHEGPFTAIGHPVAWVGEPNDAYTVGRVSDDVDTQNAEANARLIAASPDLLTALKSLREEVGRIPAKPLVGTVVAAMFMADDAIAKAEGK